MRRRVGAFDLDKTIIPHKAIRASVSVFQEGMRRDAHLLNKRACMALISLSGVIFLIHAPLHSCVGKRLGRRSCEPLGDNPVLDVLTGCAPAILGGGKSIVKLAGPKGAAPGRKPFFASLLHD